MLNYSILEYLRNSSQEDMDNYRHAIGDCSIRVNFIRENCMTALLEDVNLYTTVFKRVQ